MKHIILMFLFLSGSAICTGQTIYQLDKDTAKYNRNPLYITTYKNSHDTIVGMVLTNANDVDSVAVYRNDTFLKRYELQATNGVVFIRLKNKLRLLTLPELYRKYKLDSQYGQLPVFIDSAIAYHPEKMYFDLNAIKAVIVAEEKGTGMKYVSILSNNAIRRLKKGDIYIKGFINKTK